MTLKNLLPALTVAAALACSACSHESATAENTSATVVSDDVAADAANGEPNSAAAPDTLPTAVGAVADADAADDAAFMAKAAQGGMLEVELGKLAQTQGANASVKEMGNMLIADHSKANDELKAIAARKGVKLPTGLSAEGQQTRDGLAALRGAEFDKAFAMAIVDDHRKDIQEFEKEANGGEDADLRKFADATLPTLRSHLQMAEKTQKMM